MKQDDLTGLPSWPSTRAYLEAHLDKKQAPLGLLCVDFDSFKVFNQTYGYLSGDLLLSQFGEKVRGCVPEGSGLIGRLNGEAFLAVLPRTSPERMLTISRIIFDAAAELTVEMPGMPSVKADLTISIGGVLWEGGSDTSLYALLRLVDQAMRRAKRAGRGQYIWVEADRHAAVDLEGQNAAQAARLAIEARGALGRGEFEPFYQPLYSVRDDVPTSAEALVRWRHPELGLLTPEQFLPFFEGSGLIVNLDLYMFEFTCKNLRRWLDEGVKVLPIFCNFSRLHFLKDGFARRLLELTEQYRVSTEWLGVEITENMLVEDARPIIAQMQALRDYGFKVAMDDFGSGYSSFGMLQDLPVDAIKLDAAFFRRDLQDFKNTAIICAIVAIAKALGMTVICEGIETREQLAFLKAIGCDEVQGFYYARPMERTGFERLLCGQGGEAGDQPCRKTPGERRLIDRLFRALFVTQDLQSFEGYVDPHVEWQGILHEGMLYGLAEVKAHFEARIRGKKFSLIYRSITPHREGGHLRVSGEAVLVHESEQPPYCKSFYFSAAFRHDGRELKLHKMTMGLIRADSYIDLFRVPEAEKPGTMDRLDENAELAPYYSMLPLGIVRYELTGDMIITYMNEAMYGIIGYTREEFWGETGGNLRQLVHPDDLDRIYRTSLRMIEGEEVPPFAYRMIRRDGSVAHVLYQQCTVVASNKRPLVQSMYTSLDGLPELGGAERGAPALDPCV